MVCCDNGAVTLSRKYSTAAPPNHPSGLSHETLMQVPATVGRRRTTIDRCGDRTRESEREETAGRKANEGGLEAK